MIEKPLEIWMIIKEKEVVLWEERVNMNNDVFKYKHERNSILLDAVQNLAQKCIDKAFKNYDEMQWK